MKIESRVSLISGGASGLGEASVRMFVEAGGRAAILDRDRARGEALARELGESACFVAADVTDPAQTEAAIDSVVDRFGAIDVAINCAGISESRKVLGSTGPVDLDWFATVVRINLVGTFNVLRLAAAAMSRNPPGDEGERGVIINTASIAAYDGQVGQAAYSASKGGIVAMTLPLARELSRHGIRVMAIAPGVFETPLLERLPEDLRNQLGAAVPFPARLGRPAEFAALVRHIVENPMLNGGVIRLDGALRLPPR